MLNHLPFHWYLPLDLMTSYHQMTQQIVFLLDTTAQCMININRGLTKLTPNIVERKLLQM